MLCMYPLATWLGPPVLVAALSASSAIDKNRECMITKLYIICLHKLRISLISPQIIIYNHNILSLVRKAIFSKEPDPDKVSIPVNEMLSHNFSMMVLYQQIYIIYINTLVWLRLSFMFSSNQKHIVIVNSSSSSSSSSRNTFMSSTLYSKMHCTTLLLMIMIFTRTPFNFGVHESSLHVAFPGYQVLSDILFRLGLIAYALTQRSS